MMSDLISRICIPIVAKTLDECLSQLEKTQQIANFVELRLDSIQGITPRIVSEIAKHVTVKAIACCRAKADGGEFKGEAEDQQNILQAANDLNFDYLDIDLNVIDAIKINNKKAKIIGSFHDFSKTPKLTELNSIIDKLKRHKVDILKFATKINCDEDEKILNQLLASKPQNENWIVLGMGEKSKKQRIIAPLLGGYLSFASVNNVSSAPGQIDYKELQLIYQQIDSLLF